ncbi:MAG TPA: hypothetical protein VLI90_19445, partial [Tepidisphaeraceae bacterium]|nr:hypothetical protein [Tepidisphaeraceae bacterium]
MTKNALRNRRDDRRLPRAATAAVMEMMERRTLLSATFANDTLTVTGTSGNDNIRVDVSRNAD